jgi:hypothetical protein
MENTEAKIYFTEQDCVFKNRRFFARQLVRSSRPLMPPFVPYDSKLHGKRPNPFNLDLWTGQASGR